MSNEWTWQDNTAYLYAPDDYWRPVMTVKTGRCTFQIRQRPDNLALVLERYEPFPNDATPAQSMNFHTRDLRPIVAVIAALVTDEEVTE